MAAVTRPKYDKSAYSEYKRLQGPTAQSPGATIGTAMTVGDRMAGPDPAEANPGPLGATRAHHGTCAHYGTTHASTWTMQVA